MKQIVSISLGASKRDHKTVQNFCGQTFNIERIGTDGDKNKAIELIGRLDGKVDAFGLGGTDLYIYAGGQRYTFRDSAQIANAARVSPIVDGSGIKNTLERRVVRFLEKNRIITLKGKKVLVVCAVDRFGLAEELVETGSQVIFGDIMFGLGLPIPLYSLQSLARLAKIIAPVITRLPVSMFYPTGAKQSENRPKFEKYFSDADVIAGDFHFIRRYMPQSLAGKTVITNTVTRDDEILLTQRGVKMLVTTTPEMSGRSFGTNVLEAVIVTVAGKKPEELTPDIYSNILDEFGIQPRIIMLS